MASKLLTIETNRLLLRPFEQVNLPHVFKGLSHPDVIKYYGVHYDSLEATQTQMDWYREMEEDGTGQWFAIWSADGQCFYGAGGVNSVKKEHRKGEIGFWLLPDFWCQGIMAEALPFVCNYAFNQLNLHRIEGFVETENPASKSVLQKLGFAHEGTMKDCEIKNGNFISLEIYSKLSPSN